MLALRVPAVVPAGTAAPGRARLPGPPFPQAV